MPRAARAREGLLDPAQQVDVGAMLGVERLAHLALEAHGGLIMVFGVPKLPDAHGPGH